MKSYLRNKNAYFCSLGEETIILAAERSVYIGLNQVATSIWDFLTIQRTFDEIIVMVTTEYDVEEATARSDVEAVLEDLKRQDLISENY